MSDELHLSACYWIECKGAWELYYLKKHLNKGIPPKKRSKNKKPKYKLLNYYKWFRLGGYRHTTLPGHHYAQCVETHGKCEGYLPPTKELKYYES